MGATNFQVRVKDRSAQEAFRQATTDARYESGHGGYTGTIGEKGSFRIVQPPDEAGRRVLLAQRVARMKDRLAECRDKTDEWSRKRVLELTDAISETCARIAATQIPIPLDEILSDFIDEQLYGAFADKWGPAACLVLKEAKPIKPLSKAKAEALAKEKWGPSAVLTIRRENHKTYAAVTTTGTIKSEAGFSYRYGYTSPVARTVTTQHASYVADTADLARGGLFREDGEYLFFGMAPY